MESGITRGFFVFFSFDKFYFIFKYLHCKKTKINIKTKQIQKRDKKPPKINK